MKMKAFFLFFLGDGSSKASVLIQNLDLMIGEGPTLAAWKKPQERASAETTGYAATVNERTV